MPELKDLESGLTNLYQDRIDTKIRPRDLKDEYNVVWNHFTKQIPGTQFGPIYLKNKKNIYKAVQETLDWYEEEYLTYQDLVESGIQRVIEGAKEDIATEREEEGEDYDPDSIGEDELDDEELWQWWSQEWSHNIADKHWLTKLADPRQLELQDVRHNGLEGAVMTKLVDGFEGVAEELMDQLKEILIRIDETIDKKHVIRWAFDAEEEPIAW